MYLKFCAKGVIRIMTGTDDEGRMYSKAAASVGWPHAFKFMEKEDFILNPDEFDDLYDRLCAAPWAEDGPIYQLIAELGEAREHVYLFRTRAAGAKKAAETRKKGGAS